MAQVSADAGRIAETADAGGEDRHSIVRELKDSAVLFGMTLSTMGAYLALGAAVVRLFAHR